MINVKERGCLSLSQQAKLISEIDAVATLESDELARADAEEICDFIDSLFMFGFIGNDDVAKYKLGLKAAMKRREAK